MADYVKIRFLKVNYPLTLRIFHVSVSNVPLLGYYPIKYLRAAWHLVDIKRDQSLDDMQCFSNPVPSDASTDWVELGHEVTHFLTHVNPIRRDFKI